MLYRTQAVRRAEIESDPDLKCILNTRIDRHSNLQVEDVVYRINKLTDGIESRHKIIKNVYLLFEILGKADICHLIFNSAQTIFDKEAREMLFLLFPYRHYFPDLNLDLFELPQEVWIMHIFKYFSLGFLLVNISCVCRSWRAMGLAIFDKLNVGWENIVPIPAPFCSYDKSMKKYRRIELKLELQKLYLYFCKTQFKEIQCKTCGIHCISRSMATGIIWKKGYIIGYVCEFCTTDWGHNYGIQNLNLYYLCCKNKNLSLNAKEYGTHVVQDTNNVCFSFDDLDKVQHKKL